MMKKKSVIGTLFLEVRVLGIRVNQFSFIKKGEKNGTYCTIE